MKKTNDSWWTERRVVGFRGTAFASILHHNYLNLIYEQVCAQGTTAL
ncbi:hypothetical protein OG252_13750 [Streptomyces sp. NBC_01352]|nr:MULTISPECIES: hypothetical protein [unclassified Streptomyces]MCX4697126.1 hypothetical protein [Streptomyces sp. NBC_01373]